MLGFAPLASAPLGATADGGIFASDITAGAPVISAVTMFEEEAFAIADIVLGIPVVDAAAASVEYNFAANNLRSTPVVDGIATLFQQLLTPNEITSGAPVIESATLTFFYDFAATKITSGAPVIDGISFAQFFNFNADDITSLPNVETLPFTQDHVLAGGDIEASAPTIPVRFLWDYQEPTLKTWIEVPDTVDVWTDVAA